MAEQGGFADDGAFPGAGLLLREFSHRATNEWASAISTISLAAARCNSEEARNALADVERRLRSFARVQHSLQMPDCSTRMDATAYLRQLCQAISQAKLEGRGIELLFVDYPFKMNSERCWLLGMIVAELITNAARHAFGDEPGVINVEIFRSSNSVDCRVTDNGSAEAAVRPGQGFKIIQDLIKHLNGTIDQQFGPCGSQSVLVFPLDPCAALIESRQARYCGTTIFAL